ncbi:uncharacterized protein EDB93DRAFT_1177816 [Suillus bovinus]|uniref:uncharacterized protein n=1 Tax=Suillus bovinus TaxID=48563 RepID=UPI001B885E31|nr:uncharacterized protein EDB93DRAFT_1193940 [Suillus bovinus]XP_041302517.1 uncharacterized protein EDB93DRAFT_1177816 [Suillus bovinus]KAG2124406.1 hypothetical protein EDB93DRAFT_1193940 [Suillus bovinus]KAG2131599.1 hypothetical protein EDB93DRAFT_1177816 [Suillus bovinus]
MSTIFNGDSQMEVITVLANCGTDTDKARQALTRYIARKQEKGRPTEHILKKLRQLELKFINDITLHTAFRDARATTCLPRSPDVPLPDFVRRDSARLDSRQSVSLLQDLATPSPGPSSPKSWVQSSYSSIQHGGPSIIEEDWIQPEEALYKTSLRTHSLPPTNAPGRLPVLSPYVFQTSSGRSRSSTLPSSSISSPSHSARKLRTAFITPPPTSPLPDLPLDATDGHDSHIPQFNLPPPANNRPFSSDSKSSSSSHSSHPRPRTPVMFYPEFSLQSSTITRGEISHPPQTGKDLPHQPLVIMEHCPSETDIPSMFLPSREGSYNASEHSGADFPAPYRDSPILRERSTSHNHNFSFQLDNALRLCNASHVVRREVKQCLEQDRGYEQHNWTIVLQECGIAEDDIPFLLNEMAREVEFTANRV